MHTLKLAPKDEHLLSNTNSQTSCSNTPHSSSHTDILLHHLALQNGGDSGCLMEIPFLYVMYVMLHSVEERQIVGIVFICVTICAGVNRLLLIMHLFRFNLGDVLTYIALYV